jgi:glutamyl-tRNA synthetase
MGITHVIRAEEWLSSLPKHVQLYRSFDWDLPAFCHLPLLRNADKSKISKRKNPVSLNHYRRAGFLPEAMLNYLALMGWAMPDEREEFSLDEFVAAFSLERVSLGGPIFDQEKLRWLNGRYLRRLSGPEMLARLRQHLLSEEYLLRVLALVRERIDTLEDFFDYAHFFFAGELSYGPEEMARMTPPNRTSTEAAKALDTLLEKHLDVLLDWNAAAIEGGVRAFAEDTAWSAKDAFMVVRVAVTGRAATPPLFETLEVLGKEAVRRRVRRAADLLRTRQPGAALPGAKG